MFSTIGTSGELKCELVPEPCKEYVNEIMQKINILGLQVASRYQRRTGMHLDVPDPPSNSARYFFRSALKN